MDQLISEVFDRIDNDAKISDETELLVLAALLGQLDAVLDGETVERPATDHAAEVTPQRAYLRSISVTGFRGIGPTCTLALEPGPGLTLVVGRNGSGKSSIAEAAELALTGDALRWAGKSSDWKSGWRNVHSNEAPLIEIALGIDGEREPRTVRVRWTGDDLESSEVLVTTPGLGRQRLESLGWNSAVKTFRPFLSYTELSTIIDGRPVDRYNALAPMLGMESLQAPIEQLRQRRLSIEREIADAEKGVEAAVALLRDHSDHRGQVASEALAGTWNLAKLESLLAGTEPTTADRDRLLGALAQLPVPDLDRTAKAALDLRQAAERLNSLQGSDADRSERLASLLEAAVEMHERHGDIDCPVCGQFMGLRDQRVKELREEIGHLRDEAKAILTAQALLRDARTSANDAVGAVPQVLGTTTGAEIEIDISELKEAWAAWIDTPEADADLADHLENIGIRVIDATETTRQRALTLQKELADGWRPIAEKIAQLLPIARAGQTARQQLAPLKSAEKWLKQCEAAIRNERFDTVNTQVKQVWAALAVDSNVRLEDVRLGTKKVDMDVTVDGDSSAALGVMSQGELHALALSLFIPRVRSIDSPFGFVILDDPVQAMDPVRVDGLARVLHDLAQTHQVTVFTHDDRLPSTIRRLQIPARVLTVTRMPRSVVHVERSLDPIHAAIDDARSLLLSENLPDEVGRRVIPGLCRQAIEAACIESGRRRLLDSGLTHVECEAALANAAKLLPLVAIALFGDADRSGDVYSTLNNKFGRSGTDTIRECNSLTHSGASNTVDLRELINRTESLAERLAAQ
jgi:energy-coupling factor transporter ATP-binding protein EcfA2